MSDQMKPIPFEKLLVSLIKEFKENNTFFSVPVCRNADPEYISAIGPAAGPHTQLAGNIVAAYGAGASHFELKTVQIIEGKDLGIRKPCIFTANEVYNTEWSTELTIKQAINEYIKAYILLKILIKEFQIGSEDNFNFILSIGYNLEGIQSNKMDEFLESMRNASNTEEWKKDISFLVDNLNLFNNISQEYILRISPKISDTVTLSTMHGCKSEEIAIIAKYLIEEKNLNTYIKLNPTLLGRDSIRSLLDQTGYNNIYFDDHIFETDIDFDSAVKMLRYLMDIAKGRHKIFGVKLTNTFQVINERDELSGEDMYLSGPALYPIAIAIAAKLADEFNGLLPISYSGGADVNNINDILQTGIYPVTVSSILLKPGGYKNITKMNQQVENLTTKRSVIEVEALKELAKQASKNLHYHNKNVMSFKKLEKYSILCSMCNNCMDVCPNRANKKIEFNGKVYIIHYDNLCNECGNCSYFCIAGHHPYLEKFTVFDDETSFQASRNEGLIQKDDKLEFRVKSNEDRELSEQIIMNMEEI